MRLAISIATVLTVVLLGAAGCTSRQPVTVKPPAEDTAVPTHAVPASPSVALTATQIPEEASPTPLPSTTPPDGELYLRAVSEDNIEHIYCMQADGSNLELILTLPSGLIFPQLSRDGSQLVVLDMRDSLSTASESGYCCYTTLSLLNIHGDSLRPLTTGNVFDTDPAWSPDGQYIAFVSSRSIGNEIYLIEAAGGEPTRMTDDSHPEYCLSWSPDAARIAYGLIDASSGFAQAAYLMIRDLTSDEVVNVLPDFSAEHICPTWSPDGAKFAFLAVIEGKQDLFVVNSDGTNLVRLTDNRLEESRPIWSPDSRYVAFGSARYGEYIIYSSTADGTGISVLSNPDLDLVPLLWSDSAPPTD